MARALYSASAEDLEIVACFLVFHEMREFLKKMQKLVIDLLVSKHALQSESTKALSWKLLAEQRRIPCPTFPFKYLHKWLTVVK